MWWARRGVGVEGQDVSGLGKELEWRDNMCLALARSGSGGTRCVWPWPGVGVEGQDVSGLDQELEWREKMCLG
jgi:hypothetical protein